MEEEDFFNYLQTHFDDALPLVVYRKPNTQKITALLQEDATLHTVTNFSESGFVFAPFENTSAATVLIPSHLSTKISIETLEDISEEEMQFSAPSIEEIISVKDRHITLVQKGIKCINDGAIKKVVLSRKQKIQHSYESPFIIFKRLAKTYTTAFVYCWYHPKVGLWLGATPETLLSIKNRKLQTMSLAGTQKYIDKEEVIWGAKEQEEQQLVTDSILENLKPLVNNLEVSDVQTHKAGALLHLKTNINASVNEAEVSLQDIIKALHPTPAVCGLPKNEANVFILQNEGYRRNYYTGFLGEINIKTEQKRTTSRRNTENLAYGTIKKSTHLFVNLRCMEINAQGTQLYVGGGVTSSSNPEAEWQETVHKLSTVARVLK